MIYLSTSTHHSNQGYYTGNKKSIFLAGPTTRNSEYGTVWRNNVRKFLNNRDDLVLFIPEPTDLSHNPDSDIIPFWPNHRTQVDWELRHLEIADRILFWIPREQSHPGLTTNVEFGRWYRDRRTWYGRPNWAEKCEYLDSIWEIEYTSKPIFINLEELCFHVYSTLL